MELPIVKRHGMYLDCRVFILKYSGKLATVYHTNTNRNKHRESLQELVQIVRGLL